jgi:hypothetical protein
MPLLLILEVRVETGCKVDVNILMVGEELGLALDDGEVSRGEIVLLEKWLHLVVKRLVS